MNLEYILSDKSLPTAPDGCKLSPIKYCIPKAGDFVLSSEGKWYKAKSNIIKTTMLCMSCIESPTLKVGDRVHLRNKDGIYTVSNTVSNIGDGNYAIATRSVLITDPSEWIKVTT